MRTLIRIVFVIFIANGIDRLEGVCDNCYNGFKEKDEDEEINNNEEINKSEGISKSEEIKGNAKITAKSLVNDNWYNSKKNLVLKLFKKKDDNVFPSKGNNDKILIKLEGKKNPKITEQNEDEDPLKLNGKKYALFEIITQKDKTVNLYCSDVESSKYDNEVWGIFKGTDHKSISVKTCDTTEVTDMGYMFYKCSSLENLDIKNFNTSNVTNMNSMFSECSSLENLDIKNFNTSNVTNMNSMFSECRNLKELVFGENAAYVL